MLEVAYDYVDVAGLKYRADDVAAFIEAAANCAPQVRLVPEPDNYHDENAIKVIGAWADGKEERHLGYVPAVLSDLIRHKRMTGLSAELAFAGDGDKGPLVQIRILAPG